MNRIHVSEKWGVLLITSTIILGCILITAFCFRQSDAYQIVLPAVSMDEAKKMEKGGECYVVYQSKGGDTDKIKTGRYYWKDGVKKEILLIGNDPADGLSNIFNTHKNRFVVKGYIHKGLSEKMGRLVFYVDSWNFISPITRDYGPREYRPDQRFFYPKKFLDEYDVKSGDYTALLPLDVFVLDDFESSYYLEQDGYYRITPWWNGSALVWFVGDIEKGIVVELKGDLPEYSLDDCLLKNTESIYKTYWNSFIVKGKLEEGTKGNRILEVYRWWLCTPFFQHGDKVVGSDSHVGFADSDLKAGIYKNYR